MRTRADVGGDDTDGTCQDMTSFPLMRPNAMLSGARDTAPEISLTQARKGDRRQRDQLRSITGGRTDNREE